MAFLDGMYQRWAILSPLHRKLVVTATILACCLFGFVGLVTPCLVLYLVATIGLDADTIAWFRSVHTQYTVEASTENSDPIDEGPRVVASKRVAVKFAIMAQSKVGMLRPTEANRLVYETVLLNLFSEHNVRYNVRISLLGEALVACFIRPREYERALDVVEHLGAGGAPIAL